MPPEGVRYLDIQEFISEGYLQEVNRRLLHPLGLALEVTVDDEDGSAVISGIWDLRDDPEGIWFEGDADPGKAHRVDQLLLSRALARKSALGFVIEPVGRWPHHLSP